MNLERALEILAAFEREDVRYVLVGSIALAAQGIIRATRDIDLMVASDAENVARIKRALRSTFDDASIDEIDVGDLAGAYPVIRYGPPDGDFVIDLIARVGDAFGFEDIESEVLKIGDLHVKVATPQMLYTMKRGTLRPRDHVDAEDLRLRFNLGGGT